jgi:hypothetical protein
VIIEPVSNTLFIGELYYTIKHGFCQKITGVGGLNLRVLMLNYLKVLSENSISSTEEFDYRKML